MNLSLWCEHDEKTSKYSTVKYCFEDKEVLLRVQTWVCPVCGIHGSNTELAQAAEPQH
ncbi:hypothetical protein [Sporomusa termitida]|uniref:Uncharacterized protein n=1 Tax=Sporomusa termitida TaxID=2377 RepID=A0A517DVP4_9FIRM|nr:hypothetical protein [Sporomusa termitida]QDR81430.1 hypothetical protein SPTER_28100 [Sporomusa termitida]